MIEKLNLSSEATAHSKADALEEKVNEIIEVLNARPNIEKDDKDYYELVVYEADGKTVRERTPLMDRDGNPLPQILRYLKDIGFQDGD